LVSGVSHVLIISLIAYGFIFAPRINLRSAADRYTVREVEINLPDDLIRKPNPANSAMYPDKGQGAQQQAAAHSQPAPPSSSTMQVPKLHISNRTIVQPDLPPNQLIVKSKVPSLLMWSPQKPKVELLSPPQPEKIAINNTRPVLTRPTAETRISDIPVTSTPFESRFPMPTPSTGSPVVVSGAKLGDLLPQSASKSSVLPSGGAMLSISEEEMAKGTIALPAVNQTGAGTENGAMQPGKAGNSLQAGNGDPHSTGNGNGTQQSQGAEGKAPGAAGNRVGLSAANGGNAGSGHGNGSAGGGAGGNGSEASYTRVTLPQNGQYGVVVVGSSLAEEFPETSRLWGGRLVYSVYLHVGLARSWILQYSLPAKMDAATAGDMKQLEAPWPTYIVRPTNEPDNINADALMIHGFVTETGHFDALALAFPQGFSQTQLLLQALQQWKFRPAKHNGQIARVEVLLIIPENTN
jgi:hypothetical protein